MKPDERTFSLRAEAACCLWEEIFSATMIAAPDTPLKQTLLPLFENHGSITMRHAAINLADACCDLWDALGTEWIEAHDLITYDWEFCPAFLRACTWTDNAHPTPPTAEAFKALIEKEQAQ